jgi:cell division septation protein DedD
LHVVRRALFAIALVLAACGRNERARAPAAPADHPAPKQSTGPDALVLRFPRAGGLVRAFAYPTFDSAIWKSSDKTPAFERVLGFDDEAGSVTGVDAKGAVVRVDLRLGAVSRDAKPKLTRLASSDGSSVYGITKDGSVVRLTPAGQWTFKPPEAPHDVIPEPDGSLLLVSDHGDKTTVWQMHPPDRQLTDTAHLPAVGRAVRTMVGDRVYFTVDSGLIGLRSRGLEPVPSVHLDHRVRALATTPSGDRIYVALDSTDAIVVIDRYTHKIDTRVPLGGQAVDLRMDPTGRYVLARPAEGDSAWVINVGTDRLVGAVSTEWRADLPSVAPNGWLALLSKHDVLLADGESLRVEKTVKDGADDTWLFVVWNGFRRPDAPDQPLTFAGDSTGRADTGAAQPTDTGNVFATPADTSGATDARPATAPRPATPADSTAAPNVGLGGFTVQFAALRSQALADSLARTIAVDGAHPRVVEAPRNGARIYRVVLGPYASKDDALRVAKASGASYWIYPGVP